MENVSLSVSDKSSVIGKVHNENHLMQGRITFCQLDTDYGGRDQKVYTQNLTKLPMTIIKKPPCDIKIVENT